MAGQIQMRKGAMLLWRLGPLEYGEQTRWKGAPEPRGMWAFPWPFFDEWFAFHQFEYKMPRRLHTDRGFPLDASWYLDGDDNPMPDGVGPFTDDGQIVAGYHVSAAFHDVRSAWIRTTGRRVVPRRQFWYSGELFSRMRPNGEVGYAGPDEAPAWYRMDVTQFAEAVRKVGGNRGLVRNGGDLVLGRYTVDHLEVFLPAGAGRIHGRRP